MTREQAGRTGYLTIGHYGGAPIRIHWTTPIGAYPFVAQIVYAFTTTNVVLMMMNLIPVRPLDGAEAWRLFQVGDLLRARRDRHLRARMRDLQRELDEIEKSSEESEEEEEHGEVAPPRKPPLDKSTLN